MAFRRCALYCLLVGPLVSGCAADRGPEVARPSQVHVESQREAKWSINLPQHPLLGEFPIDGADGYEPREVALIAVASNPELRTVRDARGISQAQSVSAGLLPNPTLAFSPTFPVGKDREGLVTGYSAELGWEVSALFQRDPERQAARFKEQSVELDIAWAEWTVGLQASVLAEQIVLLEGARAIHRENVGELEKSLAKLVRAESRGSITRLHSTNAQAELFRARTQSADNDRKLAVARAQLAGMLGEAALVVRHLVKSSSHPRSLDDSPPESLAQGLGERRPDLLAIKMALRSQDASYQAATRRRFPRIELGVTVQRDTSDVWVAGPTLLTELPVFDRAQGSTAEAKAEATRLSDLYAQRENEARQKIRVNWADARGTETTLSMIKEAITRQMELTDIYMKAAAAGQADLLLYYSARNTLFELRLEEVAQRLALSQALIELKSESARYELTPGKTK